MSDDGFCVVELDSVAETRCKLATHCLFFKTECARKYPKWGELNVDIAEKFSDFLIPWPTMYEREKCEIRICVAGKSYTDFVADVLTRHGFMQSLSPTDPDCQVVANRLSDEGFVKFAESVLS